MFLTTRLKTHLARKGADEVGVAELAPFMDDLETVPSDLFSTYTHAVSIAIGLDRDVIAGIREVPTERYAQHYRDANARLDALAAETVQWVRAERGRAQAIPASAIVDEDRLLGAVSHKAIARMAGLGWQGRSLLIVSPLFGPAMRLVTVLTDLRLYPDKPMQNRCGPCTRCAEACPAGAIRGEGTEDRYAAREDAIDLELCGQRTATNSSRPAIGARICGLCIRACPWGSASGLPEKRSE